MTHIYVIVPGNKTTTKHGSFLVRPYAIDFANNILRANCSPNALLIALDDKDGSIELIEAEPKS